MNRDLDTVLDAALQLPLDQQRELVDRLIKQSVGAREKTGNVRKHFGTFNSGDPRSAANEKIDEDLASAYSDNHEPENLSSSTRPDSSAGFTNLIFEDWDDPKMDVYNDYDNARKHIK